MRNLVLLTILAITLGLFYAPASHAGFAQPGISNLIENGDFETGDLEGWEQASDTGLGFWFVYDSDVEDFLPPPVGEYAAVSDQNGPDVNALYQDIDVPPSGAECSAIVYYDDDGLRMVPPDDDLVSSDDFADGPSVEQLVEEQIYRVDITDPNSDPVDIEGGVLLPIFENDPDVVELGYTLITFDLTPFAGQTVRLRALTNAYTGPMNGAIDAVSCFHTRTAIPTLSEWGLISMAGLIGIIGLYAISRRTVLA